MLWCTALGYHGPYFLINMQWSVSAECSMLCAWCVACPG